METTDGSAINTTWNDMGVTEVLQRLVENTDGISQESYYNTVEYYCCHHTQHKHNEHAT